jgi:hypothetical protein
MQFSFDRTISQTIAPLAPLATLALTSSDLERHEAPSPRVAPSRFPGVAAAIPRPPASVAVRAPTVGRAIAIYSCSASHFNPSEPDVGTIQKLSASHM